MKKVFILLSFIFISGLASAQLGFGIKGAFTMSNLTTDWSEIKESAKAGWQFGGFVRVGDKWHLQPEAYFTAKTGQLKYQEQDMNDPQKTGEVTQDITFNTVDIPVLIGYKLIDPPALNVRLQAGPVASMVVNKTFDVSGSGIDPAEPDEDYKNAFRDLNWGLQVGAGVDFLFLTADVRYEIGLNNLYDQPDGVSGTDLSSFKNHVFMISVGWKIL